MEQVKKEKELHHQIRERQESGDPISDHSDRSATLLGDWDQLLSVKTLRKHLKVIKDMKEEALTWSGGAHNCKTSNSFPRLLRSIQSQFQFTIANDRGCKGVVFVDLFFASV